MATNRTFPFRNEGRRGRAAFSAGLTAALSAALSVVVFTVAFLFGFTLHPHPRLALAAAQPQLIARAGYHGQAPENGWAPIEVVARNRGDTPFRGYVEILQLGSGMGGFPPAGGPAGGGKQVLARWRFPIEIPPGGLRALAPLVPLQTGVSYEVHLVDPSGKSVTSVPVQSGQVNEQQTVIAVVGERSLPYLGAVPGLRGGAVVVVEAQPELLPRASSGWFSFDAVVIDGVEPLRRLEPAQLEALRLWVELGGTLVLGTGSDAAAMAQVLGPRLFPWTVRGTVETTDYTEAVVLARRVDPNAPALGQGAPASVAAVLEAGPGGPAGSGGSDGAAGQPPAPSAPAQGTPSGRSAGPGQAAATRGTVPLAYQAQVGLGRVYAWATRLDTEPWLSWPRTPEVFSAWLGSDLVPAAFRRADALMGWGGGGMGFAGPPGTSGGSARVVPVNIPVAIEAGGPRGLFLSIARSLFNRGHYGMVQDLLLQAARDVPGLQLPRPGVLAAGIAGYLLLIGPVTFGWLGRRRKREWAWVAVPAVAVLAIGGAYLAGTATGAVAPRNAAGYLIASPAGDRGLWSGTVAAYRPAGVPAVELRPGALAAPFEEALFFGPPVPQPVPGDILRIEPTPGGQQVSWPAATPGRIPTALVQADVSLPGTLEARWRPAGGDQWEVEVVNGLGLALREPFIVHGDSVVAQLPDLAPGDRYSGRVRVASRPGTGHWTPPSPLLSGPMVRRGWGSSTDDWRARQEARLQQVLSQLSMGVSGGALLVARIDGSPVFAAGGAGATGGPGAGGGSSGGNAPGGAAAGTGTQTGTGGGPASDSGAGGVPTAWSSTGVTLLIQPLAADLPGPDAGAPAFRLANTVFPLEAREARAAGLQSQSPGGPVEVDNGTLEFEWRPPAAVLPRARALEIQLPFGTGISLFDHETASWVVVRPPGGQLPAGAPAWVRRDVRVNGSRVRVTGESMSRFFGPDGRLALRVEVNGRTLVPFPVVALDVDGEVSGR